MVSSVVSVLASSKSCERVDPRNGKARPRPSLAWNAEGASRGKDPKHRHHRRRRGAVVSQCRRHRHKGAEEPRGFGSCGLSAEAKRRASKKERESEKVRRSSPSPPPPPPSHTLTLFLFSAFALFTHSASTFNNSKIGVIKSSCSTSPTQEAAQTHHIRIVSRASSLSSEPQSLVTHPFASLAVQPSRSNAQLSIEETSGGDDACRRSRGGTDASALWASTEILLSRILKLAGSIVVIVLGTFLRLALARLEKRSVVRGICSWRRR